MILCALCKRPFTNEMSLQQHVINFPSHIDLSSYLSSSSLWMPTLLAPTVSGTTEIQTPPSSSNSSSHATAFTCPLCNKSFRNEKLLSGHLRYSPAHRATLQCKPCKRKFRTQGALDDHLQNSKAHPITHKCEPCNRTFKNQDALNQHLRDAQAHAPSTPLDIFFKRYPSFPYDPKISPSESWKRLKSHFGWKRTEPQTVEARILYHEALEEEVRLWFGSEDDIESWHNLSRAVGINPLPVDCEEAKKVYILFSFPSGLIESLLIFDTQAIIGVFVNIVDLISWARESRAGEDVKPVQRFKNLESLREYTIRTEKFFPSEQTRSEEGNVVLRHLLRLILRGTKHKGYCY
ncbi:hypothetical protein N7540_001438 [Penicillium herquei]|nr:hypothetical protein N7540_001438 [Penicillium herquei]